MLFFNEEGGGLTFFWGEASNVHTAYKFKKGGDKALRAKPLKKGGMEPLFEL